MLLLSPDGALFGINYFDTAPGYCEDRSETFTGDALAAMPEVIQSKVYISTKSYMEDDPTADAVIRRIEMQLKRLRRDRIDFYHMWMVLNLQHFHRVMEKGGPYEGAIRARKQGLIGHICCSTHASGEDVAAMVKADVFEALGKKTINATWRNAYMTGAHELRRGVPESTLLKISSDLLGTLKVGDFVVFLETRIVPDD